MDASYNTPEDRTHTGVQNHKKPLIVAIISLMILATGVVLARPVSFPALGFRDLSENHEYYEAIRYLAQNNVYGYPDRTFRPDGFINRAEFVHLITGPAFLNRHGKNGCILRYEVNAELSFFSDVPLDAWYADDVCIAFTRDIANGYPDGTFKPGQYISFAEASKMLVSVFAGSLRSRAPHSEGWYQSYVKRMAYLQAIPKTITGLEKYVTRGEVAEMLYRLQRHDSSRPSIAYAELVGEDVALADKIPPTPTISRSTVTRRNTYDIPLRRRTAEQKVRDQRSLAQKKREQIYEAHKVLEDPVPQEFKFDIAE